jgi:hypothetical protein
MLIAGVWLYRVPFMQETDEQAHADYVYALYDAGGWYTSDNALAEDYVTPQVQYLAAQSNYWALRLSPHGRAPVGYGSKLFFQHLDRAAPPFASLSRADRANPYVAFQYPAGYYVLAARAMQVASTLFGGSLSATYFAARTLGILFLAVTLVLSFAIFRMENLGPWLSLALTAAMGAMPLTSWVSSYVQPDTLTLLFVTLVLYQVLRYRTRPSAVASFAIIATLAAGFFVKQHYATALSAAVSLTAFAYLPAKPELFRRRLGWMGAACALLALACFGATHLTPVGALRTPPALYAVAAGRGFGLRAAANVLWYVETGLANMFWGGQTFSTFWLSFGDLVTPYIASERLLRIAWTALAICSGTVTLLFVVREFGVIRRLARIWKKHASLARRLCFGDIVLNVYVIWVGLLLGVFAASSGQVYIEGRYLLPILLPTILLGIRYVPRLFKRAYRRTLANVVALVWLAYGTIMSPLALAAMERRFYGPTDGTVARDVVRIVHLIGQDGARLATRDVRIAAGYRVTVLGVVVATQSGTGLRGMRATLDRKPVPFILSDQRYANRKLIMSNFSIRTPADLRTGPHHIALTPLSDSGDREGDGFVITVTR